MLNKHHSDKIEDRTLAEGVVLKAEFLEQKENRLLTLLLKGFIVYLLSMGSIGFYLTAFQISFQVGLCHVVILLTSFGCAMLYYRLLVENLGYLLLFVSFTCLVFTFRDYINSGFYAIVNISIKTASTYFKENIYKEYTEKIGNRYVTVTFVALFIGVVLDILLNVYVSRRMQYMTAIGIIMSLNLIPLYLEKEPDLLYVWMMLAGIAMALVFRAGKHYSPQVSAKRNSLKYHIQGKRKKEIAYVYDVKGMLQAGIHAVLLVILVVTAASVLRPKESFNTGYSGNKYKNLTTAAMTTFLVDGLEGLYQRGGNNGGVGGGKLGTVSTVYLDNQTDLTIKFAPYTTERMYIRTYIGIRYNPYQNEWTSITDMNGYDAISMDAEAKALQEAYEQKKETSARAVMELNPVGVFLENASAQGKPSPYYTTETTELEHRGYRAVFYPRLMENTTAVKNTTLPYTDEDLFVPEENIDAVAAVAAKLGTIGTNEKVVAALKNYYQENYPYTIRPGKTPKKKDFVNYFLEENKKGYCSYFASAAVLIFRYMGIPARYVEGYAIDYEQVLNGELVENTEYGDYYDGYSELGETACVQVDVTDADAHAWVEIYDPVYGWYPVDVTPTSMEEEDYTSFWDAFAEFMGEDEESGSEITENTSAFTISDTLIRNLLFGMLAAVFLTVGLLLGRRFVLFLQYWIRFCRASYNDKLILYYSRMVKKYEKKHAAFQTCKNYETQLHDILSHCVDAQELQDLEAEEKEVIAILTTAGFSNHMLTEAMYQKAMLFLKKLNRQRKNK